jgi:hypothetical protein
MGQRVAQKEITEVVGARWSRDGMERKKSQPETNYQR